MVNEEATDISYGVNTFTFGERMHPVAADSCLDSSPYKSILRWRVVQWDVISDILQMTDFFDLTGGSNRVKIRHIKIEIDVHSLFLGYVPCSLERQSMCIEPLEDGGRACWVSFDKRAGSHYPKYWDDEGGSLTENELEGKITYAKGLELSNFKAKKKTTKQKPQMEKQKLLIRKVYLQGGMLYEGDYDEVEALQAAKDEQQIRQRQQAKVDSGKSKNTTPKNAQKTTKDTASIVQSFHNDACSLSDTPKFARKLYRLLKQQLPNTPPPPTVLHKALTEAHAKSKTDATRSPSYRDWMLEQGKRKARSGNGGDGICNEDEDGDNELDGESESEDESDADLTSDSESGDESGVERRQGDDETEEEEREEGDESEEGQHEGGGRNGGDKGDSEVGSELYKPYEVEFEDEETAESLGPGEKKDGMDMDVGDDIKAGEPSDRAPSQTASAVSTQSNQLLQGSSGSGNPGRTFKHAHDIIFHNFKRKPPRGE